MVQLTKHGLAFVFDRITGDHAWMVPLADAHRDHPRLQGLELPRMGSGGRWFPLATKTLLVTRKGSDVEFLDKKTGALLGEYKFAGPPLPPDRAFQRSPHNLHERGKTIHRLRIGQWDEPL